MHVRCAGKRVLLAQFYRADADTMEDNLKYYIERAKQERAAAKAAQHPSVASSHREMAVFYERLIKNHATPDNNLRDFYERKED